jgi:HEAT repeat protein
VERAESREGVTRAPTSVRPGRRGGGLIHYCFACYAENERASGPCERCGAEIAAPAGTSYDELLLWALDHPVRSIATNAAAVLGRRRTRAAAARLRPLVERRDDPYLAATALRSLAQIEGVPAVRGLLERLRSDGSIPVRATAAELLEARTSRQGP